MNKKTYMKSFLLAIMLLTVKCAVGQELGQVTLPSPTATALARYGDIPMSYYTGRANIEVPIYSTEQRGIPLNVSLTYDTSGINASSLPSWTGYGWSLNAGGVITRVVQGGCDELDYSQTNMPSAHNYFTNPETLAGYVNTYQSNHDIHQLAVTNMLFGSNDYNPDVFYFNFMGKTGRFFYGQDAEWHVLSDDNLMVEFDVSNNSNYIYPFFKNLNSGTNVNVTQLKTIKGFTIVDDDGTRYIFGANSTPSNTDLDTVANSIEYSIPFFYSAKGNVVRNTHKSMVASAWYLTEVQNRFGVTLYRFKYDRGLFVVQINKVQESVYMSGSGWGVNYTNFHVNDDFPFALCLNSPVYLKSIEMPLDGTEISFSQMENGEISSHTFYQSFYDYLSPSSSSQLINVFRILAGMVGENNIPNYGKVVFSLLQTGSASISPYQCKFNAAKDIDPIASMAIRPLEWIRIKRNGTQGASYKLGYMNANSYRLLMSGVQIFNKTYSSIGKYDFSYYSPSLMPKDLLNTPTDYWGYFNNNGTSKTPSLSATKSCMLKTIKYPTGGMTELFYGLNSYTKIISDDRQSTVAESGNAGGLRVDSILNYSDGARTEVLGARRFVYEQGELFARPKLSWNNWVARKTDGGTVIISYSRNNSIVPLCNSFGPHIGYSKVKEMFADGSRKEYSYSNMTECRDHACVIAASTTPTPYDSFSEVGYKRGKLKSESVYDSRNIRRSQTTYEYRTDNVENKFVYASNLSLQSLGSSAAYSYYIGGVYKMFYPKYDVVATTKLLVNNDGYVNDHTIYQKADYDLYANITGSHSSKAEIRKCLSSTTYRTIGSATDTLKTMYEYPVTGTNFTNSFFLPLIRTRQYHNGSLMGGKQTAYVQQYGFMLPATEIDIAPSGTGVVATTYHTYGTDGLLQTYTPKGKCKTKLFYDSRNRLIAKVACVSGYSDIVLNENAASPLMVVKKNGASIFTVPGTEAVVYRYTSSGLLESVTTGSGQTQHFRYDDLGQLTEIRDTNDKLIKRFEYNLQNK